VPKEESAGAVVFRRENNIIFYLLLHYQSGHWDFPKGHIEAGENKTATVLREIQEETGITDAVLVPGFKEWIKYFFRNTYSITNPAEKKKAPLVFKIVTFYVAETNTKKVIISEEHLDYAWLPFEEALAKVTHKNAKHILTKAHAFLEKR